MKIDLNLLNDFNLFNPRDLTGTDFEHNLLHFCTKQLLIIAFYFLANVYLAVTSHDNFQTYCKFFFRKLENKILLFPISKNKYRARLGQKFQPWQFVPYNLTTIGDTWNKCIEGPI